MKLCRMFLAFLAFAVTTPSRAAPVPGSAPGSAPDRSAFSIRSFGARGDGATDDTRALQAAIDAAAEAGGGSVEIPPGVFLIRPGLTLRSGVALRGHGPASTLRVVPNAGNYEYVFTAPNGPDTAVTSIVISRIHFDQNCAANASCDVRSGVADNRRQAFLYLFAGSDITVEDSWFDPICGVNTIVVNGATVRNVQIRDNYFRFQKTTTKDPTGEYDNSAVYLEGRSLTVLGNRFEAELKERARGAVELHGGPAVMTSNSSSGYETLVHAATSWAGANESNDIVISANVADDAATGIRLWSRTGSALRTVAITGNVVRVANARRALIPGQSTAPFAGILFTLETASGRWNGDFENVTIAGNAISLEPETRAGFSDYHSGGIILYPAGRVLACSVVGNTISNSPTQGIRLQSEQRDVAGCVVAGNTIRNAGNNSKARYRAALAFAGSVYATSVSANQVITEAAAGLEPPELSTSALLPNSQILSTDGLLKLQGSSRTNRSLSTAVYRQSVVDATAALTPDAMTGDVVELLFSSPREANVPAPSAAIPGQRLTVWITNGTHGPLAPLRWANVYHLAPWTQPPPGTKRSVTFQFDGADWWEVGRSGGDVPW